MASDTESLDKQEIISYMDASDPDYDNIQQAQAEIGKMIAKANEKKRIVDNFQVLIEIQNRIALPAGSNLIKKGSASCCVRGAHAMHMARRVRVTYALWRGRASIRARGSLPYVRQQGEVR
jgi:hypothetical protein